MTKFFSKYSTFTELAVLTTSMLVTNNCCCTAQVLGTNTPLKEDQKNHRSKVVAGEKRKALSDEVSELKVKRRAPQTDAEAVSASADDFADQAEKLHKLPLLA